jgi:conjugal transfer pilus assembly protein TraD
MKALNFLKTIKNDEDSITVGKRKSIFGEAEKLSEPQLNHHVHIVGASGYGKTVLLTHIIRKRIYQNKGLLFIDLKGDIDTINKFTTFASQAGRADQVSVFSLSDQGLSQPYNLVGSGTATQLRDKIIQSYNWSEEYYKNQSSSFLLKLLIGLCFLRDKSQFRFHLGTILKCTEDLDFLKELTLRIPIDQKFERGMLESCFQFLNQAANFNSLQGLRTQLESIVYSDFGGMVTSEVPGLNLYELARMSKIGFIFLDTRRYGETAKAIGKFILQDLKMVSARIDAEIAKEDRKPFTVIIDEFADLAQEDFIGFLDRARSSKMSVIVAHQEICDLLRVSPEFAGRLMGNTSTLYAFLQKRPESADTIASIAGTKKTWKETLRSQSLFFFDIPTGDKSLREVEEFNLHPNLIKSLRVGQCVCIKKYPRAQSYLVSVHPEGV